MTRAAAIAVLLALCSAAPAATFSDWIATYGLTGDNALPPEFWRSTVPPTLFRIRALRAEPVPEGYAGAPGDLVFKASKKQRAHRMTHGNTSGAVRMMATIQPNPRRVRPWSSCHRPGMTKFTIGGTLLINWNISLGAFDVKREVYP